ncbi:MAG: DUF1549 domain-containing protein [Opitutaceae bacterium]
MEPKHFYPAVAVLCVLGTGTIAMVRASLSSEQQTQLPPPALGQVDFVRDIKPIFEVSCVQCHARGKAKGSFSLETREDFLEGGETGTPAVAGKSAESLVVELISGLDPENIMPKKGKKLNAEQVAVFRAWIDQGMPWPKEIAFIRHEPANLRPRELADMPVATAFAANPIDGFVDAYFKPHGITWPALVDDRTYARRVWLDVVGLLPPTKELMEFLEDSAPDKRGRLVQRLLTDRRGYADHWITFWNDMLRNDYKAPGGRKQITDWLYPALADNLPYDRFVAELIDPSPDSEGFTNGIVWRGTVNASMQPPIQAAQNVAQVFLGVNLKCASCHDSFINEYTLADAYGLAGVYASGPLEIAECDKPTGRFGKVKFLYESLGTIDADADRGQRKKQLAEIMTSRKNGRLSRTIVNRFWQRFMGRGLVEPVDEMDKPAWSPEVMDWLAEDLVAHGYDLKHTIARILTSRAYQLPGVSPGENESQFVFHGPRVRRLDAEQFVDAIMALTGVEYPAEAAKVNRSAALSSGAAAALPLAPRWIWDNPGAVERTKAGTVTFTREVELAAAPTEAYITLAADNSFDLRINGKKIGAKSSRSNTGTNQYEVTDKLQAGRNTITVIATNEAIDDKERATEALQALKTYGTLDTSAGLILYARIRAPGQVMDFVSDAAWQSEAEGPAPVASAELGGVDLAAWNLGQGFLRFAASTPDRSGGQRASAVLGNPLLVALGRPNREQVVTVRADLATTLQALELANGSTFAAMLRRGAEKLMTDAPSEPERFVSQLYRHALGRDPTAPEATLAVELVGRPASREGVEDLLWVVAMLPEFQLIR